MTRALAFLCCAASLLLSHTASARPKVALTQIEGDASGDVRDAVAEALEGKELALIGSREVNRAVDKLGDLADLTEKDFKKLASQLEADAVVAAKLDKVGKSKTLKFRLFVHKKMAKGFTVSFKDPKSEKFRTMLHDKMLDKIGASGGDDEDVQPARKKSADDEDDPLATRKPRDKKVAKATRGDDEDDRPAKKTRAGKAARGSDDDDARVAKATNADEDPDARPKKARPAPVDDEVRPSKKAAADAEARSAPEDEDAPRKSRKQVAAADDGEEIEGGIAVTAEPRRGANLAAVRLDVGMSVVQRSFKFNSNIANKPKNVAMSPVPGVRFETELYPLAFSSSPGIAAGLGAGVDYDKTLKLNLTTSNPTTMATYTIPVKQSHYSIGLRYRLAFGKTETSPTLTLGAGYGKRLFSVDRTALMGDQAAIDDVKRDTPESEYTVIDPGLSFRLPVTRMVAFTLGGRGMIVTSAGPIQNAPSYGRAKVYGAEAMAAVDVVLGKRFALRFAGEFVQVGFQFLGGTNTLANTIDNDPASKNVGGLADRSIGGSATLAVMY